MNMRSSCLLVAALCVLAACGGGGGDAAPEMPAPAPSNRVPGSAAASAQAFVQYTGSLGASESTEPLELEGLTPPTSETEEPQSV
jgi:hypothetical protein